MAKLLNPLQRRPLCRVLAEFTPRRTKRVAFGGKADLYRGSVEGGDIIPRAVATSKYCLAGECLVYTLIAKWPNKSSRRRFH
jgi:hypothetical protein